MKNRIVSMTVNFKHKKHIVFNELLKKNFGLSRARLQSFLFDYGYANSSLLYVRKSRKIKFRLLHSFARSKRFYNRLLRLKIRNSISNYKLQSSWRGLRFRQGLPVNGQRTHSNAKTPKRLNSKRW